MIQMTMFDRLEESYTKSIQKLNSEDGKEEGMAAAEKGASPEWIDEAERAIKFIASVQQWFTADDILEDIESTTKDLRALGPVLRRMAREGICKKTDRTVPCKRRSRHATDIRVWESLIFRTF